MDEKHKLAKEKLAEMLEAKEITLEEVASVMGDYASEESVLDYCPDRILDNINGWIIDEELAIKWGVATLTKRIGKQGYEVAQSIMTRLCANNIINRNTICAYISKDCIERGCSGTFNEWYNGFTGTNVNCVLPTIKYEKYKCPCCGNGDVKPQYDGKFHCDKCDYNVDYNTYHHIKKEELENE